MPVMVQQSGSVRSAQPVNKVDVLNLHLRESQEQYVELTKTKESLLRMAFAIGHVGAVDCVKIPAPPPLDRAVVELHGQEFLMALHAAKARRVAMGQAWLKKQLDLMVDQCLAGRINTSQKDPSVCDLSYYTRWTENADTSSHFVTKHMFELHSHYLVNKTRHYWKQVKQEIPAKYLNVLLKCPASLQELIWIVKGVVYRRESTKGVYKRDVTPKPVVQPVKQLDPDPAIVIFDYVLAGWDS